MFALSSKQRVFGAIILAVLGVGVFLLISASREKVPVSLPPTVPLQAVELKDLGPKHEIIGRSVKGRAIEAYTYGSGKTHLLFVGGVHGGYEWNSVLLSYQFMDYLKENPRIVPDNLTVTVIPSANPDGVFAVIGKEGRFVLADAPKIKDTTGLGRMNAHDVDLNRNFDCKWKPKSMWRGKIVSAGTAVFSEPEAKALRDFVLKNTPHAVIFWHSQSNAVYASECKDGILPETLAIMNAYAHASGYAPVKSFDAYEVTGDAEGWLASINIPAITVELQTHETVEWERNLSGIQALFEYFQQKARV